MDELKNPDGKTEGEIPSSSSSEFMFRYYEDQWNHVRHHEVQMATAAWQVIFATVALVTAFSQTPRVAILGLPLERAIAFAIVVLGMAGICLTKALSNSVKLHIIRARNARRSMRLLEEVAESDKQKFPNSHLMFLTIHLIAVVGGIVLLILTFVDQIPLPN